MRRHLKALMEETNWDRYGTGNNPKCANCMAHCGYEATAVNDAMGHPLKGLRVSLRVQKPKAFATELPHHLLDYGKISAFEKNPGTSSKLFLRRLLRQHSRFCKNQSISSRRAATAGRAA